MQADNDGAGKNGEAGKNHEAADKGKCDDDRPAGLRPGLSWVCLDRAVF